jgi:Flp pilus assembly protein TadG
MAHRPPHIFSALWQKQRARFRDTRGATAITFAITVIPMLLFTGLAVDGGRVFMVKSQLSSSVDVTAIAAVRMYSDAARDKKAKEYFSANFNADLQGIQLNSVEIIAAMRGTRKTVVVNASAEVPTIFMQLAGIKSVTVTETATAQRTDYPLELVLALDNTGSMALNEGSGISRLSALKTAATTLVNATYGSNETTPNIRIGIIPYTAYVNVGKLLEPGYVELLPGYTDRPTGDPLAWKGCVDADASNPDADDNMASAAWDTAYDTQDMRAGSPVKASLFPAFGIKYDFTVPDRIEAAKSCDDAVAEGKTEASSAEKASLGTKTTCEPATITEWRCVEASCANVTLPNPRSGCKTEEDKKELDGGCKSTPERTILGGTYEQTRLVHPYNTSGQDGIFGRTGAAPSGIFNDPAYTNYRYYSESTWKLPLSFASKLTNRTGFDPRLVENTSDNNDNATESIVDDSNNDGSAASPNTYCPDQALPLEVHSKTAVNNYINTSLKAFFPDWGTFSNQGLLWGWRMLSPELPLKGQATILGSTKAVVLMTDGNLFHPGGIDQGVEKHDGIRTPYGFGSEKTLVNNVRASRNELKQALRNRLRKTCENMRREGITVYTVTFDFDPTVTAEEKDIYRQCATSPSLYFDAPDAATLKDAFDAIADDLAGVRLIN